MKHFRLHFHKKFWEIKYLGIEKLGVEAVSLPHCVTEQKVDAGEDYAWSVQPCSFPSSLSIEPSRKGIS